MFIYRILVFLAMFWAGSCVAFAQSASVSIDAPELAAFGPHAVGFREDEVIHKNQIDPDKSVVAKKEVTFDRKLRLLVWYPAATGGRPFFYQGSVEAETPPFKSFNIKGVATRDAAPKDGSYPVVVISHGFANDVVMMNWIGENIASKGYVVVAIAHRDLPYANSNGRIEALIRRPLDIAFVLKEIRGGLLGKLADPQHIALIGYSMGGYGVLTAAGARPDGQEKSFKDQPIDLLTRYAPGGAEEGAMNAGDIDALIAIAPGGKKPFSTWGDKGIEGISAPMLLIAGDADRLIGYDEGILPIFEGAVKTDRTLLVFKQGGHNVGTGPVPDEMTERLWDQDWFADPVWRKDRMNSISLHFMTAFLDLHLKGDKGKTAYFAVSNPDSSKASWSAPYKTWDETSQGGENTAWKGFKRNQQVGLMLRHLPARTP